MKHQVFEHKGHRWKILHVKVNGFAFLECTKCKSRATMKDEKVSPNTNCKIDIKANYFVLEGWTKKRHFTTDGKTAVCGSKVNYTHKANEILYDDGEGFKEKWISLGKSKWVRMAEYNYCKRCVANFKKKYKKSCTANI